MDLAVIAAVFCGWWGLLASVALRRTRRDKRLFEETRAKIENVLGTLSKPPEPAAAPPVPAATTNACSCAICSGKVTPDDVLRLTHPLGCQIDAALISVSSSHVTAFTMPVERIGPNGVTRAVVLVLADGVFERIREPLFAAVKP